jgi:hypothetical protein
MRVYAVISGLERTDSELRFHHSKNRRLKFLIGDDRVGDALFESATERTTDIIAAARATIALTEDRYTSIDLGRWPETSAAAS